MDEKDKDERKQFPEEFEYLDEIISEPIKQIHAIEKTLKDLPDTPVDKAKLQYNPPGYAKAQKKANFSLSRGQLEQHKENLEKDVTARFEGQLKGMDDEDAGKLREVFQERLHPNPFEDMNENQIAKVRKMEKDIDHSQYFMLKRQKDYQREVSEIPKAPMTEPEKTQTPAERYSQTLSSEKQKQNISKDKVPGKTKEADEPQIT